MSIPLHRQQLQQHLCHRLHHQEYHPRLLPWNWHLFLSCPPSILYKSCLWKNLSNRLIRASLRCIFQEFEGFLWMLSFIVIVWRAVISCITGTTAWKRWTSQGLIWKKFLRVPLNQVLPWSLSICPIIVFVEWTLMLLKVSAEALFG